VAKLEIEEQLPKFYAKYFPFCPLFFNYLVSFRPLFVAWASNNFFARKLPSFE
jgi:hypothetical protein